MKKELFLALTRISLGWIFLWAFLDKTFGLHYSTAPEKAWLHGGSPTYGFLKMGTTETFKPFFSSLAGNPIVDWLFMLGCLGIGVALILGVARKISTLSATIMLFLMWLATFPSKTNPLIDDHIIYIFVLQVLFQFHSGEVLGLGKWWNKQPITKKFGFLR